MPLSVILLVIVCVAVVLALGAILPANVMLPPERVIFPDTDPNVIPAELTFPDTVIVPSARPAVPVPKFRASEVVVVVVPESVAVPVALVLQPWVASFVVGAAQVPPAVPKPAVEPLLSQ